MTGKPKPNAIKRAEGNPGRRRLLPEVQAVGSPRVPVDLTDEETELWMDLLQALPPGLLARADEMVLEVVATYWARFRALRREIAKQDPEKMTLAARYNMQKMLDSNVREMRAFGGEIGLSPVARSRIGADNTGSEDALNLLLGGDPDGAWATHPKKKQSVKA